MIRRAWHALRQRSLLQKFGLISLVAITLIGLLLGQMLRTSVQRQVLASAIAEAEVVSRLGLQRAIGPSEVRQGLSASRTRAAQLALRTAFARIDVVDAVLWNLDGKVVFATDSASTGRSAMRSPELSQALAGKALARITDVAANQNVSPRLRRHGTVVEVYQPVQFGSTDSENITGVLRTSIPYGPVAQTIAEETKRLYLALALAFVVLYMVLFRLVANASKELRRRADENEQQARRDALTGLPNRTQFTEVINGIFKGGKTQPLAIALIDLDRFKDVNDTLGHHHGDLLLVEVGRRLRYTLRPSDAVARLGGDEFALVLRDVANADAALGVAARIVAALENPFEIEGLRLDIGASVGVAMAPDHGHDLATLLQRADVAMYQAKRSGAGCTLYDPSYDHHSREQLAMVGELRRSMADQLVIYYQPKIELDTNRTCGVEALVRWDHPDHGLLPPSAFVPLAERSGMMDTLTRIVLEQSLDQLRRWLDARLDLHLAVNVSARGLHDAGLDDVVDRLLTQHDIPPERLVLEITETTIAADPDGARDVLAKMGGRGVRFSIDDFGTGYSSLAVLRSLPVNELKIDRQFVGDLDHLEGQAIVEYSIQLGHMLGLTVVAEGVEDESNQRRLTDLGCDIAQGYWFARPMAADDLTAWMEVRDQPTAANLQVVASR